MLLGTIQYLFKVAFAFLSKDLVVLLKSAPFYVFRSWDLFAFCPCQQISCHRDFLFLKRCLQAYLFQFFERFDFVSISTETPMMQAVGVQELHLGCFIFLVYYPEDEIRIETASAKEPHPDPWKVTEDIYFLVPIRIIIVMLSPEFLKVNQEVGLFFSQTRWTNRNAFQFMVFRL